jgi:hypothetical protein
LATGLTPAFFEKDEMEKKDPEVKAQKTSRYMNYCVYLHWGTMECKRYALGLL